MGSERAGTLDALKRAGGRRGRCWRPVWHPKQARGRRQGGGRRRARSTFTLGPGPSSAHGAKRIGDRFGQFLKSHEIVVLRKP